MNAAKGWPYLKAYLTGFVGVLAVGHSFTLAGFESAIFAGLLAALTLHEPSPTEEPTK